MATMDEVISRVDAIRPNIFTEEQKYRWISHVDGLVSREVMNDDAPEYNLPDDADTPLLVGHPYEDMYDFYLMAMIELANKEYDHYNNAVMLFQERYQQYKLWYIQHNVTTRSGNFRNVMG